MMVVLQSTGLTMFSRFSEKLTCCLFDDPLEEIILPPEGRCWNCDWAADEEA